LAPPVVTPLPPLALPPFCPGPVVPPVLCARATETLTSVKTVTNSTTKTCTLDVAWPSRPLSRLAMVLEISP
jgi:hypothetical protein